MLPMAKGKKKPKLRMVCAACSSEQVTREAWAEWNVEVQGWQLGALFDYAFCLRCQTPTHIEERLLGG